MKKKLIEVALPLPEVNDASAYDKMPGIGPHPKGIHQWWARLPLPTARAILFASVVDDPETHPEIWPTEDEQNAERERLLDIVRRMMTKRLHEASEIYAEARSEMLRNCHGSLPKLYDPFAGGGSIPLEGNRLGFEVRGADLNPVAVLLNKCNLELVPRWLDCPPVNPEDRGRIGGKEAWRGPFGLAADVRHYAKKIQATLEYNLAHLYPKVRLTEDMGGGEASVIAWIWARTVSSPNPAALGKHVPLVSTYWLSSKKNLRWLSPEIDKLSGTYKFQVMTSAPPKDSSVSSGTKIGRGAKFRCLLTNEPIGDVHLKSEARAGRLSTRLIAIVAEGRKGRVYLPALEAHEVVALSARPVGYPSEELVYDSRYLTPPGYGMTSTDKLFTARQLSALTLLSDLIKQVGEGVKTDAIAAGQSADDSHAYADTVRTFLSLALDRCCDFNNSLCRWSPSNQKVMNLFGRQAIPMVWDFAEANIVEHSVGGWSTCSDYVGDCIEVMTGGFTRVGEARQVDAATGMDGISHLLVSTDPPYYDNVPYADISDFFYVWLRRTIGDVYPDLFSTLLVPKIAELTASPQRFEGDKKLARDHFELGFRRAFAALRSRTDPQFPLTVYYAFKQDDEESGSEEETAVDLTTGWETLLEALIESGFQITATWPVRASQAWRMRAMGSNALASYIVLACRPRPSDAGQTDRRSFIKDLKRELPPALRHLQQGNIAPVDFAQAAIGPGMAIYSSYSRVFESSGAPLSVRGALSLINQSLTEVLSEQEDEFDAETRWAIAWFEQHGFDPGGFGDAELLSKAKVTSIANMQHLGLLHSRGGEVRLKRPEELGELPRLDKDSPPPIWDITHRLLKIYYYDEAGDTKTGEALKAFGTDGNFARDLAYRLFHLSERKKRPKEALAYNALVLGWPEIVRIAREGGRTSAKERVLFEEDGA